MDRGTDTLTLPRIGFPPPVAGTSTPTPGQISQAPSLPTVTPAIPRPAISEPNIFSTFPESWEPPRSQPPRGNRRRRGVTWLILLAVISGVAYAGVTYGPDLVDRVRGTDANGPSAALGYPTTVTPAPVVRTATFTISDPDLFGGTQDYEVTADFESGVARVVLPRSETPDLEILSVWDQAFIRRIDEPVWYSMPRGDFPVDQSLGRGRWVRTLDELIPPSIRRFASITEATESSVGTEPARRLVVRIETAPLLQEQAAAASPPVEGVAPTASPLPPGVSVPPVVDGVEWLQLEIWVDDNGIVRKSVMPAELGGETITVTSVSPDPWEPRFPTPDEVQPLTARALLHLGM